MCLTHQQPTSLIVTQVLSMTRHDNSLPKWPFSKTSITPRLPKSPRVSPLPKNRSTERPLVVPNSCLRPKLSSHSLLAVPRSILEGSDRVVLEIVLGPYWSKPCPNPKREREREHGHHVAIRAPIDLFF